MDTLNKKLEARIMRRVYIISHLRTLLAPPMVKLYIGALVLWQIGHQVFVAKVFANSPGLAHPLANLNFFTSAFTHTHLAVQVLVSVLVVALLWAAADLARRLRSHAPFAPSWL